MSSYEELFSRANPDETINKIPNAFATLLVRFFEVKRFIKQCSDSNILTDRNIGISNLNNNSSSRSPNDVHLRNKLGEDLNQINEAFHQLEQLVREPIKNFESSLSDFFNELQRDPRVSLMTEQVQAKVNALENHVMNFRFNILLELHRNIGISNLNNNNSSHSPNDEHLRNKLGEDLNQINEAFHQLEQLVREPIKNFEGSLSESFDVLQRDPRGSLMTEQVQDKVNALENHVMNLRFNIPLVLHSMSSTSSDVHRYLWKKDLSSGVDKLPGLHLGHKFLYSSVFTEFKEAFEDLDIKLKHCLLCFAIVPENVVVKKRLLINWWVGECLVDPPDTGEKTDEEIADEILKELISKGFIEAVKERHKLVANRNYLLKAEDGTPEQLAKTNLQLEKLQTIFNVNDPFPFLKFDWFSKMKNVKVLYLGRWQSSGKYHIEVASTEFLKGLRNMIRLRLLSVQGISGITELPDSVGKLTTLRILDLKACHNLEALPDKIALLKQLTHLDISECYLLDGLPKGLAHLSKLQVLKGFLIGNSKRGSLCTLEDLIGLRKLGKLSINTSSKAFPTKEELQALSKLEALQKLAIAWSMMKEENGGTGNSDDKGDNTRQLRGAAKLKKTVLRRLSTLKDPETPEPLSKLEKLVFQCFPHEELPGWLIPGKLQSLKKLYIRGGKLKNLGETKENEKWKVENLRLKYLEEFKMDWEEELSPSFPDLIVLEKDERTAITSCPCDENGLWLKESSTDSNTL
ncbi:disease resistance RPP13-like protein 4 isoform X2 [Quercus robur]|uniref:disease resistance RPP13-like protein 4 isoform X2 n=1 Tax=Quercus robur TaxID=38942 RepID=UPI002163EA6F|nr:disease resistance RPP13-like protein 4 isoform X2 [Quercus robur]